jgi:phosphatidylserine/phosphatidylglycerophosphate/cardiolipin synthase-like enzyme
MERSEIETLRTAKVSVDVAMYSYTDRELAAELVRLAHSGVRVRVYRDSRESMQVNQLPGEVPPDSSGPSLFTALQEQLGLNWNQRKLRWKSS